MGYPGYIGTNLLATASVITPDTEDANYPKAGLYDGSTVMPFRFDDAGGTILVDFGAPISMDAIAIIEANFNGMSIAGPATGITLKAGTTTACTDWSTTLDCVVGSSNIFKHFAAQSYRYWSLVISETHINHTYIGELVLGNLTHFSFGYLYGWTEAINYNSVSATTPKGHRHSTFLYKQSTLGYKFSYLSSAQVTEMKVLATLTNGTVSPFLWVPDTALTICYYGNLTKDPIYTNQNEYTWSADLGIIESAHIVSLS